MRGDRVEIVIDAGGGTTKTYDVRATRAGRRVEVTQGRGVVEVTEVTRGGTAVRTARFMSSRVLALVEHPAPRPAEDDDAQAPGLASARTSRVDTQGPPNQARRPGEHSSGVSPGPVIRRA